MAKDVYQKPIDSSHSPYADDIAPNVAQHSIGQAIRGLPGQYFKVLTRPSVTRFAEEKGKASWGIVWIQLRYLAHGGTSTEQRKGNCCHTNPN